MQVGAFWIPAAFAYPGVEAFDPLSSLSAQAACEMCLGFNHEAGVLPVFRAGSRDQSALQLAGKWAPTPGVSMRVQAERLWVSWPSGENMTGWGDVRLGSSGIFWNSQNRSFSAGLDWGVKLPNASDEGEFGSDETDVHVGFFGRWQGELWQVGIGANLVILGDPLQFANQDDALLLAAQLARETKSWRWSSRLLWRKESPRNPDDVRVLTGAQFRGLPRGLWVAFEGGVGATEASPSWQAGLRFGVAGPCRAPQRD